MSIFDRFSSKKGKDAKGAPKLKDDAEKKAFAAVPSGKEAPEKTAAEPIDKTAEKKAGKKGETPAAKKVIVSAGPANHIIVRPLVTEKSNRLGSLRQYIFEVQPTATKVDVKNAVHQLYGIRPTGVQISNVRGKIVRYGRTWGKTIKRRKAMVTLPEGKSIDVFSA